MRSFTTICGLLGLSLTHVAAQGYMHRLQSLFGLDTGKCPN